MLMRPNKSSRFGVRSEEIPQNIVGGGASGVTEFRIVRNLTGDVHPSVVPGVNSAHQFIKFYFSIGATVGGIFFHNRSDLSLTVTQRGGGIESRAIVSQCTGPVVKCLLLRRLVHAGRAAERRGQVW